jgi:hypothetical protein
MRRSGKGSGGGAGMNKNVSPGVRTGKAAQGKRHEAVAQIGGNYGNHATSRARTLTKSIERVEGPRPISVPLGNEVARNVGKGGCGTGRTLYGQSGSQGTHGSVNPGNPPAKNTDILRQFGPDVPGRR